MSDGNASPRLLVTPCRQGTSIVSAGAGNVHKGTCPGLRYIRLLVLRSCMHVGGMTGRLIIGLQARHSKPMIRQHVECNCSSSAPKECHGRRGAKPMLAAHRLSARNEIYEGWSVASEPQCMKCETPACMPRPSMRTGMEG